MFSFSCTVKASFTGWENDKVVLKVDRKESRALQEK